MTYKLKKIIHCNKCAYLHGTVCDMWERGHFENDFCSMGRLKDEEGTI